MSAGAWFDDRAAKFEIFPVPSQVGQNASGVVSGERFIQSCLLHLADEYSWKSELLLVQV